MTMAEIINLRQARKAKARAEKQQQAERNRAKHGRSKAEKDATRQLSDLDLRRHDAHRRDGEDD